MSIEAVKAILIELGVEEEHLAPNRHVRADLALDSTETTELELELRRRFNAVIDLWDRKDYTIEEIAQRIAGGTDRAAPPLDLAGGVEPAMQTGEACR